MISHVPSLERLITEFSKLPGIGPKTAQRLAYHVLRTTDSYSEALRAALVDVESKVKECPKCFSYTEDDLCRLCQDEARSDSILCVVEDPADISRIDNSGAFQGRYHVLHGTLSPLQGIGPEDIRMQPLLDRVQKGVKEVILALDADIDGDTTALYIAKQLSGLDIKVTRLAHGIPIGGDIDFIDHRTLGRALENRTEL